MIAMQKVHSFAAALDYNDSKLNLKDKTQRAEVLDHNFMEYNKAEIMKEIGMLNKLNSKLTNDGYHVALSFSEKDTHLRNADLIAIAQAYKKGMGFTDDNLFVLYKHNDGEDHQHIHVHLLLHRLSIDEQGKVQVVSDSNNYRRSETVCRELERRFNLEKVRSSHEALDRAPTKDELEMMQRTGHPSERILMQEKVKSALGVSVDIQSFIENCKLNGIYLLFNQSSSTGRVSGITYISQNGFIAKGQKLGNQFKWNNLSQNLNYGKQSRDGETVRQTNIDTRSRFENELNKANRGSEIGDDRNSRISSKSYKESKYTVSEDEFNDRKGGDSRFTAHSHGDRTNEETESEIEESISNGLSHDSNSLISNLSGLLGSVSAEQIDEEERRKRRRTRR